MPYYQAQVTYYSGAKFMFGLEAEGIGDAISMAWKTTPNNHKAVVEVVSIPPRGGRKIPGLETLDDRD